MNVNGELTKCMLSTITFLYSFNFMVKYTFFSLELQIYMKNSIDKNRIKLELKDSHRHRSFCCVTNLKYMCVIVSAKK